MKEIPKEYRNQFKSFVDYKDFMMERAKNQLAKAFEEMEKSENKQYETIIKNEKKWKI